MTLSDFYRHFDACESCTRQKLCATGDDILACATNDTAARMCGVEVLDLAGHERACLDCRPGAACQVARGIKARAGAVIDETGRKSVPA